jgi:hypothetical protein
MSTRFHTIVGAAVLLAGATIASAQTQSLTNAGQIWHGTPGSQAGSWVDLGAVGAGDSRTDLIIGAPGSASIPGAVYVIFGGPVRTGDLNLTNADTVLSGAAAGDRFGATTAAGNVITLETSTTRNLVVGAPGAMGGRGVVYVFLGGFTLGSHLTTANAAYTIIGNPGDQLGTALATADLDNDGFREIIMGAGGNDALYVIKGSASLSGTRNLATTPADVAVAGLGLGDVIAAGDVTGDGISDLLIGSGDLNAVYLYKGRTTGGLPTVPDAGFGGARAGDRAGASIRLLDIDHDGIRDIIIGAPGNDGAANDRTNAGAVYLIWGGPGVASRGLAQSDVTFYGTTSQQLGTHISAGDINRDTPSDIVMLAPGSGGSAGELDIYYGRSNRAAYGADGGNGQRIVDFADPTNIDRKIVGDVTLGAIAFTQVFEVTGEGARDIVASVPSQDAGTGAVYFTISPSLGLSSSATTVVVNRGGSSTSPGITITNRSLVGVTWSATSNQTWLTTSPGSGSTTSTTPGQVSAAVNAAGLAPGSYPATVTVSSTSKHLEMSLPVAVTLVVTDTRLIIDGPGNGTTLTQPFPMSGWAIDTGATTNSGVDTVHVYAFRSDGSAPQFVGVATYGNPRSDVAQIFGAQFAQSGFSLTVAGLAPGSYRLVAYARHKVTSAFTAVAFKDVAIAATGFLLVDGPSPSANVTSTFAVNGWAIDQSAATGTGVDAVHLYAFSNEGAGAPVFLGSASYGAARPDIAGIFGAQFRNSGYQRTVTGLTPGKYVLGVYAHSTVSNGFSMVKTVPITVIPTALMSIDAPSPEMVITTPGFGIAGWAIDRGAASGTGVDALHVYAYPQTGGGAPIFLGVAAVGFTRGDIGSVYGARFTNSGYILNVNAAASGLTPGIYNIVVWAHSTATGSFNNVAVVRARIQ